MKGKDEPAPLARVYRWLLTEAGADGAVGRAVQDVVPLANLQGWSPASRGLRGRFASVHNAAVVGAAAHGAIEPGRPTALGDAIPDAHGNLVFDPGRGGGRIDKVAIPDDGLYARYVQAARFGEVNTYYHLDAIASYVADLLGELGAATLPAVTAVVYAHAAAPGATARDGRRCPDGRWVPFQGGHYRLPGAALRIPERAPLSSDGEIHLGPGQKLAHHGALARAVGGPYRANASHNPAIIFHEYGHHICRHTADFRANRMRPPDRQSNRKTAIDEGSADYWAAAMLGTPHIWFFHHQSNPTTPHRRSLTSTRTMADQRPGDAHANGTIWAAALWDLRSRAIRRAPSEDEGGRRIDRLMLQALLLIGRAAGGPIRPPGSQGAEESARACARSRGSFRRAGAALLEADRLLYRGAFRDQIADVLAARGIHPEASREPVAAGSVAAS